MDQKIPAKVYTYKAMEEIISVIDFLFQAQATRYRKVAVDQMNLCERGICISNCMHWILTLLSNAWTKSMSKKPTSIS